MTTAFPLTWPDAWPRTSTPISSRFDTTLAKALANVQAELRRFGNDSGKLVKSILISSNYTLGDQRPRDPGVAIYFEWDGISTCVAVDRYQRIEDNLQAIFRCIEAERTKLRHGGLNLVRAAFRGYAALPPPGAVADPWPILGIQPTRDTKAINLRYRELASQLHPDAGGDAGAMARLNVARDEALRRAAA